MLRHRTLFTSSPPIKCLETLAPKGTFCPIPNTSRAKESGEAFLDFDCRPSVCDACEPRRTKQKHGANYKALALLFSAARRQGVRHEACSPARPPPLSLSLARSPAEKPKENDTASLPRVQRERRKAVIWVKNEGNEERSSSSVPRTRARQHFHVVPPNVAAAERPALCPSTQSGLCDARAQALGRFGLAGAGLYICLPLRDGADVTRTFCRTPRGHVDSISAR